MHRCNSVTRLTQEVNHAVASRDMTLHSTWHERVQVTDDSKALVADGDPRFWLVSFSRLNLQYSAGHISPRVINILRGLLQYTLFLQIQCEHKFSTMKDT